MIRVYILSVYLIIQPGLGCHGQPRQLNTSGTYEGLDMLEPCTPFETYDYFTGSELSFGFTYTIAALFIPCKYIYNQSLIRLLR